jgi:hypothetical protein
VDQILALQLEDPVRPGAQDLVLETLRHLYRLRRRPVLVGLPEGGGDAVGNGVAAEESLSTAEFHP